MLAEGYPEDRRQVAQAKRLSGFGLAVRQPLDPSPDDLDEVARFVEHESDDQGSTPRGAADDKRGDEVDPEDEHDQGQAAHRVNDRGRRAAQRAVGAEAGQREHDSDGEAQGETEGRHEQRHGEAAQRPMRVLADEEQEPMILEDLEHQRSLELEPTVGKVSEAMIPNEIAR